MSKTESFNRKEGELFCESVSLQYLAKEFGTPLYVYSKSKLTENCLQFQKSFSGYPTQICYAVKANDNHQLLKEIFSFGFGADVVSIGEIEKVLRAGVPGKKIIFSGVGKNRSEIKRAIEVGVSAINVESFSELKLIREVSHSMGQPVSIHLRVNPNIDVKTNPYIATGLYETKFGIADESILELARSIKSDRWVSLKGLACHIGSQILELESFHKAGVRLKQISDELRREGFPIERVDLGGGLGIAYQDFETSPSVFDYSQKLIQIFQGTQYQLLIEPGRSIVGEVGGLLTQVIHTKSQADRHFTIVDAAMNDLIRPCLYEAYHEICSVKSSDRPPVVTDVVGPVCETGDFLGLGRKLNDPSAGELLLVKNVGAYGFSMASNYNSRARAAEVLISDREVKIIRRRETLESLWQFEEF